MIDVIILTKNEGIHLERAINSLESLDPVIHVVDSGSMDSTLEIAYKYKCKIYYNKWLSHSSQFNWALSNCEFQHNWIMRLDADEYLTESLAVEIRESLNRDLKVNGFVMKRGHIFLGKFIKYGGTYPSKMLRLFRRGYASCEEKWMDEHLILSSGASYELKHPFFDHNLNTIGYWIEKHNHYATREVVDILSRTSSKSHHTVSFKHFLKYQLYEKLPLGMRAFLYFCYRYFIRLGFLDGFQGFAWHFLQGFWYRYLVDIKLYEVELMMSKKGCDYKEAVLSLYGVRV